MNNKLNRGVCDVLRDEGYIESYDVVEDGRQGLIDISLRYGSRGEPIITRIDRVSRPGRRVYRGASDLPRPLAGLGICIVSTSRGVLSDRICRVLKFGVELVAIVLYSERRGTHDESYWNQTSPRPRQRQSCG